MTEASKKPNTDDALLSQLNRMAGKKKAEPIVNEVTAPGIREAVQGISLLGRAISKAAQIGGYIWSSFGKPVWDTVSPVLGGIARFWKEKIWDRFAYATDSNGERVFSKKRAAAVIGLTAAFAMAVTPMLNTAAEAVLIGTTSRSEIVYLHTVNPHPDGTYSIKGCRTMTQECTPENTVYYNVEGSVMRDIWSMATHGSRFIPRLIVGTVAPGYNNECTVQIFDAPWEWAYQQFDTYPQLLDISCHRVDSNGQTIGEAFNAASLSAPVAAVQQPVWNAQAPVYAPA